MEKESLKAILIAIAMSPPNTPDRAGWSSWVLIERSAVVCGLRSSPSQKIYRLSPCV
jgi:hypothetical protein